MATLSLLEGVKTPHAHTTYTAVFHKVATSVPDKEGYVFRSTATGEAHRYTYKQFLDAVNRVVNGFANVLGIPRKRVICAFLPNVPEYAIVQLATITGGYVFFPLNPLYSPDQLARLLPRVTPALVVTNARLAPKLPAGTPTLLGDRDVPAGARSLHEFLATPAPDLLAELAGVVQPDDECFYGCTSGSTGEPTICVYTHFPRVNPFINIDYKRNVPADIRTTLCFAPLFTSAAHFQVDAVLTTGTPSSCSTSSRRSASRTRRARRPRSSRSSTTRSSTRRSARRCGASSWAGASRRTRCSARPPRRCASRRAPAATG